MDAFEFKEVQLPGLILNQLQPRQEEKYFTAQKHFFNIIAISLSLPRLFSLLPSWPWLSFEKRIFYLLKILNYK